MGQKQSTNNLIETIKSGQYLYHPSVSGNPDMCPALLSSSENSIHQRLGMGPYSVLFREEEPERDPHEMVHSTDCLVNMLVKRLEHEVTVEQERAKAAQRRKLVVDAVEQLRSAFRAAGNENLRDDSEDANLDN